MEWTEYKADKTDGDDYVPVSEWGSDHWSTFAYLETRAVDAKGQIDNRRMRANMRLHRHFFWATVLHRADNKEYPTRLKGGSELKKHDDWSCLEDMVAAGLLRSWFRRVNDDAFNNSRGRVEFTELGLSVAAELRRHKANGGQWSNFEPSPLDAVGVE